MPIHGAAAKKMAQSRALIDAIVTEDRAVYGVSTGFGKLSDVHISREEITQLQHNLVRSHATGIGDAGRRHHLLAPRKAVAGYGGPGRRNVARGAERLAGRLRSPHSSRAAASR